MYLAHTRPAISYALSIRDVIKIISYLKAALGKWISFTKNSDFLKVEGYIDADWVENVGDR